MKADSPDERKATDDITIKVTPEQYSQIRRLGDSCSYGVMVVGKQSFDESRWIEGLIDILGMEFGYTALEAKMTGQDIRVEVQK